MSNIEAEPNHEIRVTTAVDSETGATDRVVVIVSDWTNAEDHAVLLSKSEATRLMQALLGALNRIGDAA